MAEKTNWGEWARTAGVDQLALQQIAAFWAQQQQLMAPMLGMQAMGAIQQGNRARQTLEARLGSLGLAGTGVGEAARALGSTFASQSVANARLQAMMEGLTRATQMGGQTALGTLQSFTGIRQAEIGAKAQGGGLGGLLSSFALALPALGQLIGGGKPGKGQPGEPDTNF